nr:unnamed protein product [Spirometra erinaceieuropaei]
MANNDSQKDSLDINTLSFKLPLFTPSNPRVWFKQIEALFATSRITSERTRYSYVLQSLPFDVAVTVEDILHPIPADEPYTRLKEAVIQRVAKAANLMLRERFTQVELGDQTPSQLMRHMRSLLAGSHMHDAIFRDIWLEKLPVPMEQVLSMLDSDTPSEELATHADRISECYPIGASCSNIQQPPPSRGKPHQGIDFDSEGPALSEHDTPYTENAQRCCTARRAPTSAGPPRTSTDAYRTDYDDLGDTVRLLCPQVRNMCSALNSLQSARKQPYSHRRSKSLKRPRQPVMATTAAGPSRHSRLFYINDMSSSLRFLFDTGAEAANSTTISTYGQWSLTLDLGLRRRFQWVFIEADVKSPIIGADFLSSFGLTVDVRHRRLTDTTTQLFTIANTAFEEAKKALADATMLHHLNFDAHPQLILTTNASSSAVGGVLHQQVNNQLQPLAFFSQKLQPAQNRYSTFSRELLAIYLATRHFRHLLEDRDFSVHTYHKPLTYALKAKPDRYSPKGVRHLDYISQFTADIRYFRGSDNVVADALSRPDINTLTSDFDLAKLADLQTADESIADLLHKPLCPPYDGPYKVVQRKDKLYVLQKADKTDKVSIDRLKPAYLECLPSTSAPSIPHAMSSPDTPTPLNYLPPPHLTILRTQPETPPTPPPISSRSEVVCQNQVNACCFDIQDILHTCSSLKLSRHDLDIAPPFPVLTPRRRGFLEADIQALLLNSSSAYFVENHAND